LIRADYPFTEAALALAGGGVVAYPTETFYGLAVDPFDRRAVDRLFRLKGRAEGKPVSVIVADLDMLSLVADPIPPVAERLMEAFWPGPLTMVFHAAAAVPAELIAHTGRIGARISSSPVCSKLLDSARIPLTATSANPSGRPPALSADEVADYFGSDVDVLIDAGVLAPALPSTVVDVTADPPVVLREGAIPGAAIREALSL
jgi:L-threonylcarbamoyladenylate synthase